MTEQGRAVSLCGVLAALVVASAITCVYARHESRNQFSQLQSLIMQRDELEVDWGRLQIEQSCARCTRDSPAQFKPGVHLDQPQRFADEQSTCPNNGQ